MHRTFTNLRLACKPKLQWRVHRNMMEGVEGQTNFNFTDGDDQSVNLEGNGAKGNYSYQYS